MVKDIKTSDAFTGELNDAGAYIKCVVETVKNRFDGELDGDRLLEAAFAEAAEIRLREEGNIDTDRVIAAALKGIFKNIDKYSCFFPSRIFKGAFGIAGTGENNALCNQEPSEENELDRPLCVIGNSIGYIKIGRFGKNTYNFLCEVLDSIDEANIKKVILDLRNNHGGNLKQAVLTARRFVPEGLIARVESRSSFFKDVEYRSEMVNTNYKVAVLVNKETMSSAEILAAAIQGTGSGILIGTDTFGKAEVQKGFPLLSREAFVKSREITGGEIVDADELKAKYGIIPADDEIIGNAYITAARYVTPGGKTIAGAGLTPDIRVEDSTFIKVVESFRAKKLAEIQEYCPGDECQEILLVKTILRAAGYAVGPANTKYDAATVGAIVKYQTDMSLRISATIDFPTQEALNLLLGTLIIKKDNQYIRAVEYLENREE